MRLARIVVFSLIVAAPALGQTGDINTRLRRALAGTGQEDHATVELSNKNFDALDQLLAGQTRNDSASRAELLSLRGVIRFLQGNIRVSLTDFAEASKLAPLSDADMFTEAMASVSLGDLVAARRLLEQLKEKNPERPIYIYWLGKLDYDQRRYDESAIELQKAVALDPRSARSWDSLGLTFDMQGRFDQARGAFERAVALNRQQARPSPWPPHNLGFLLLRMNRPQEAEAALRESLRYDPGFEQAHYHLGRALEKEGREPEAIQEYLTAVNADANASDACYSLALLYRKLHRDAEAEEMFAEYKKRKQSP